MLIELCSNVLGRHLGAKTHDFPVRCDKELGEVPRDISVAIIPGCFRFQPLVKLAGTGAVDLDLRKHREIGVIPGFCEFEDFLVGSGFLRTKLVTREAEDGHSPGFMKGTQTCVLGCEASLGGKVDDQQGLLTKIGKSDRLTRDRVHGEFFEVHRDLLLMGAT